MTSSSNEAPVLESACDRVSVGLRIRPLNSIELESKSVAVMVEEAGLKVVQLNDVGKDRMSEHSYDAVFGPAVSTARVYQSIASPLVQNTLDGYNSTIFAYGQTSSGKTHTMVGSDADPGVLKLSMKEIFGNLESKIASNESLVRVSYLELYNEEIRDLLRPREGTKHQITEDPTRGPVVNDLHEEVVTSESELDTVLAIGEKHRSYGETAMNSTSSRSHVIFRVIIESGGATAPMHRAGLKLAASGPVRRGSRVVAESNTYKSGSQASGIALAVLNLVDLAGSERQQKTGATGSRLKEGNMINKSLLALGTVISTLAANSAASAKGKAIKHIPYRDSKLTRLLQGSLGGNARTCMLAAISPASRNREETQSTLRYASRAKRIVNTPTQVVIDSKDSMLASLKKEISALKEQLAAEEKQSSVVAELTQENEAAASEMEQARAQADQMQALLQMTVSATKAAQKVGEYATSHKLQRNMKAVAVGRRRLQSVMIENRQLITSAIAEKMTKRAKFVLEPQNYLEIQEANEENEDGYTGDEGSQAASPPKRVMFAESETSRHISALTAIGEDEDDDDDEDDEEAEEDFFDTSIETLTARTTTRLRAASDRHVALKAERDDLTERKTLVEEELRAVEAESEGVSKELEKLRERADRASRRAKKDSIRRPKLEEVANLAAKEAAELLAARDDAEKERNMQLAAKARAESDLKLLRIRVTTAEQEITERKLQLVNAQDEAVGLRVQAKAAEEMSGRRIEIDLPAAQVAHNDLREERDKLKSRVEFEQRATIDAASDVEALERILFSTRGEVETQRVQSVYAVDELSAADEATRNATAQCDRHEAAAAFALAHQALESRDAIHIEENLAKRQLATTEQVHALERNAEELAIVLEVVRTRAREKCLTAALAVDRACAFAQDRLGAESAAFDAAKASIQIQSERAAHESTRLDVEWQEKQVLTESLETTIDREHRCAERLRGRVGSELVCQHDSLEGPQSKLDDARSEAAHMSTLSNHASVLLAAAADRLSAAEADADRCADAADAAYCADLAIIRHCDLTRDELVASSSGGAAVKELAMQTNCHETTLRGSLATLELRVFAAEEDATHASSATTQVEMELTETRAKHNFQCGSYSGMGERAPLENPLVSSAKELAQDREEGLAAVTKQLLDAERACKLASVKVARLNVERDRDAALRAMSNAERTRLQRAMDALAMEQLTMLLASDAIATVQLAAEDSQARLDLQSEQGRDLDNIQAMLYDEQLAAQAACAAQGDLVNSLDQCVAPEAAATASIVGQLGHAMRTTSDISGALRDARREEAKTRIERDEAVARVSNKASRSAATSVKVRDVIARRALLNAELDVMRDSLIIAQAKLGARDRRDRENKWVTRLWQQAAQLFEGENGLCNIDQILPDSDLKDEARTYHVLDDRRSAASIENYDSEHLREIPNFGASHQLPEAMARIVRGAACNLRAELNNEENRRRKLAIEVETLRQETLRRKQLRTALLRSEADRNMALADLDVVIKHVSIVENCEAALREVVSSSAEHATSALSKTAVALGSAEVLRASLLAAHGQVERAAAEAERMRAASLATEDNAAQANTTLDQKRVLATHVASKEACGAVVRSSIETARMIVSKAAVGANAERDSLTHRAKKELEARDKAGAVNVTHAYFLESIRRERRDSLAKHVAALERLHIQHGCADEETTKVREAVTEAARVARHHDTRFRDGLLLSACTSDSIVASTSTHLRHNTNAAEIKAKQALKLRKRITEAIRQKKKSADTVVQLHAKFSADVDMMRAKVIALRDELAVYQKLAVYHSGYLDLRNPTELSSQLGASPRRA